MSSESKEKDAPLVREESHEKLMSPRAAREKRLSRAENLEEARHSDVKRSPTDSPKSEGGRPSETSQASPVPRGSRVTKDSPNRPSGTIRQIEESVMFSGETDEALSHLRVADMKSTFAVVKKLSFSIEKAAAANKLLLEDASLQHLSTETRFVKQVGRAIGKMKLPPKMPMWRHRMQGRKPEEVPEYLVLKGKRHWRALAWSLVLMVIKPQLILRNKELDMKKHKQHELLDKLIRQAKVFDKWTAYSTSVPLFSIEEDSTLDFTPAQGVFGSRQWWNSEKRMMEMKVRVKGIATSLVESGMPPPSMTNFLIRLCCDRNYFDPKYLWPIESAALEYDQYGATKHMFPFVADEVVPDPTDADVLNALKNEDSQPLLEKGDGKSSKSRIPGLNIGKNLVNDLKSRLTGSKDSPPKSGASRASDKSEVDFGTGFGGNGGSVVGVSDSPRRKSARNELNGQIEASNISIDPARNHMIKLKIVSRRGGTRKMYYNAYRMKMLLKHFLLTRVLISHVALSPWFCGVGSVPEKFPFKVTYNCRVVASLLYEALCLKDPFLPPVGYSTDGTYDARISFQSVKVAGCLRFVAACCGGGAEAVVTAEEQQKYWQNYWEEFEKARREQQAKQFTDHSQSNVISPRILDAQKHQKAQDARKVQERRRRSVIQQPNIASAFGDITATLETSRKLLKRRAPFVSLEEIHKLLMKPQEFLVMRKYINSWLHEVADMLDVYIDRVVEHVVESSHSKMKKSHTLSARSDR